MKIVLIIFISVLVATQAKTQNYLPGDTLNVVSINGANLRDGPGLKSKVLALLYNGEKVIVLKSDQQMEELIDGFEGHWIKIHSLNSNVEGFVFDAYLSHYPVLSNFECIKEIINGRYKWTDYEMYDYLPAMLKEYALQVFQNNGCQVSYSNGSDGEGAFSLTIHQLSDSSTLIEHGYWEGYGIELELLNPRISEVYYLIKNIIKFIPSESVNLDEVKVKTEQHYGQVCIKLGDHSCIIRIIYKRDRKISILFNNACC